MLHNLLNKIFLCFKNKGYLMIIFNTLYNFNNTFNTDFNFSIEFNSAVDNPMSNLRIEAQPSWE